MFTILEALLALIVVFSSIILAKVLCNEYLRERTAPSVLCSGVQTLDHWLPFGLSKATSCQTENDTLMVRIGEEILVVVHFLMKQGHIAFRYMTECQQLIINYLKGPLVAFEEAWYRFSTLTSDFFDDYIPYVTIVREKISCCNELISSCCTFLFSKFHEIFSQVCLITASTFSNFYERLLVFLGLQAVDDW